MTRSTRDHAWRNSARAFVARMRGYAPGMWLYLLAGFLIAFGLIGSVLSGGIFTIIVLPVGVIVLVVAFVTAMWARGTGASAHGDSEPQPLPHTNRVQPGSSGTASPEQLVDARREAQ